LLSAGHSFEEIAKIRGRQITTVVSMVATLIENGELEFRPEWVDRDRQAIIEAACARLGTQWLKPLKEAVPPEITFDEIRLMVAKLRREQESTLSAGKRASGL
jgi:ATP-dependent DNA helicase RecQ